MIDTDILKLLHWQGHPGATFSVNSSGQQIPAKTLTARRGYSSADEHRDRSAYVLVTSTPEFGIKPALAKPGDTEGLPSFSAKHRRTFRETKGVSQVQRWVEGAEGLREYFVSHPDTDQDWFQSLARMLSERSALHNDRVDWKRVKNQTRTPTRQLSPLG